MFSLGDVFVRGKRVKILLISPHFHLFLVPKTKTVVLSLPHIATH